MRSRVLHVTRVCMGKVQEYAIAVLCGRVGPALVIWHASVAMSQLFYCVTDVSAGLYMRKWDAAVAVHMCETLTCYCVPFYCPQPCCAICAGQRREVDCHLSTWLHHRVPGLMGKVNGPHGVGVGVCVGGVGVGVDVDVWVDCLFLCWTGDVMVLCGLMGLCVHQYP